MPDDDPGPQTCHRDASRCEQFLDLAPAAQVSRQIVTVIAEPAEVVMRWIPARRPPAEGPAAAASCVRSRGR